MCVCVSVCISVFARLCLLRLTVLFVCAHSCVPICAVQISHRRQGESSLNQSLTHCAQHFCDTRASYISAATEKVKVFTRFGTTFTRLMFPPAEIFIYLFKIASGELYRPHSHFAPCRIAHNSHMHACVYAH